MVCNNPMESWPFLIDYKNFPFGESTESIESQKFVGAFYYDDIFLSLSNGMQQSNGKLDISNGILQFPFDKSTESIESTKVYEALLLRRYFSKSHK